MTFFEPILVFQLLIRRVYGLHISIVKYINIVRYKSIVEGSKIEYYEYGGYGY